MFRACRSQLIELLIPSTVSGNNAQVYFQNQPQLQTISGDRTIYIKSITTFTQDTITASPLTSGNPVASAADILNAVLVLSVANENAINMVPLSELCYVQSQSFTPFTQQRFLMRDISKVDWTKSYVQMINAPAVGGFSYLFNVYYDYAPDPWDIKAGGY